MSELQAPLLAVDIGNQQIKLGLFPEGGGPYPRPSRTVRLDNGQDRLARLAGWLPEPPVHWTVASVQTQAERRLCDWVRAHRPRDAYRLLVNAELPIDVALAAPESVGTDRLLAAVAVNHLRHASRPAIVVDAGSAITVDLVDGGGAFQGGVILPGFRLVARALAEGTDRLPLVEEIAFDQPPAVIGKSTVGAIRSGLFWGNVGAVREIVARMCDDLADPAEIFVAGGDAALLASRLPPHTQVIQDLVLSGIALSGRTHRRQPPGL